MKLTSFDPTLPIPDLEHLRQARDEYLKWPMSQSRNEPLAELVTADIKVAAWATDSSKMRVRRRVIRQLKAANQLLAGSVVREVLGRSAELKVIRAYASRIPYQTGGVVKVVLIRADGRGRFDLATPNSSGTQPSQIRPEYFEGYRAGKHFVPDEVVRRHRRVLFWTMVEAGFGPDPASHLRFGTGDRLGAWSRSHDPRDPLSSGLGPDLVPAIYDDVGEAEVA